MVALYMYVYVPYAGSSLNFLTAAIKQAGSQRFGGGGGRISIVRKWTFLEHSRATGAWLLAGSGACSPGKILQLWASGEHFSCILGLDLMEINAQGVKRGPWAIWGERGVVQLPRSWLYGPGK